MTTYLELYDLLEELINILNKHQIKYWADGGTLLGAVRHNGIIPNDDDCDIGIIKNTLTSKCIDEIKNMYLLTKTDFGYKVSYKYNNKILIKNKWSHHLIKIKNENQNLNRAEIMKLGKLSYDKNQVIYTEHTFPFVDITEYELNVNTYTNKIFKQSCYSKEGVDNLILKNFGNFFVNVPIDYITYLNNYYGMDWNEYRYTASYDHKNEKKIKNIKKILITDDMRIPADYVDLM